MEQGAARPPATDTTRANRITAGVGRRGIADAIRHERRVLRRHRSEDEVAELLAGIFGMRLLPPDVLARLRATRRSRRAA